MKRGEGKERHYYSEERRRKEHKGHQHGAKTFRRGRAIAFLEILNTKRSTLKQQLHTPELQSINQILVGELKAIDMVISEFTQLFEIHECEMTKTSEAADDIEGNRKNIVRGDESEELPSETN